MYEALQCIVGTAICDSRFRQNLLTRPASVLGSFDLTQEEREAIGAIRASTIQGFARELHGWMHRDAALRQAAPRT